MNLPIVSFEIAKDLKELGFDWKCTNIFITKQYGLYKKKDYYNKTFAESGALGVRFIFPDDSFIYEPEPTLIIKWFREVHNIDIFIRRCSVYYNGYVYELWKGNEFLDNNEFVENLTYENAELEGIKVAIKYLKNEAL